MDHREAALKSAVQAEELRKTGNEELAKKADENADLSRKAAATERATKEHLDK